MLGLDGIYAGHGGILTPKEFIGLCNNISILDFGININ